MDIIKCNKCGHVLLKGTGIIAIFGKGVSIGCRVCGNTYVFGQGKEDDEIKRINDIDDKEQNTI